MGTGSNKHVGLDAVISLLDAVASTFDIVFLMLSILSVNTFIKSLLLN